MPAMFPIEHDYEFYVFLKSSLPPGFRIESEPSSSYYSDWMFHTANEPLIRQKRQKNELFLARNLSAGTPQIIFRHKEAPLLHNRLLSTQEERNSLRAYLASKEIFISTHWPTHELVHKCRLDIEATLWIEKHVISFPVAQEYGTNDMEYICQCVEKWKQGDHS